MMQHQKLLKDHGMKATSQRLNILDNLEKMGHATLEEVYAAAKPLYPTLSLTTVYRNLHEMMDKGIIKEIQIPKQKQHYEITKEPHIHLVCEGCRKVEDFMIDTNALIAEVEQQTQLHVLDNTIVLSVVCKECKTQN